MTLRALWRGAALFLVVVLFVSYTVHRAVKLRPRAGPIVASVWRGGALVAREVVRSEEERPASIAAALVEPGSTLVLEKIVADAPLARLALLRTLSLVPGLDGVEATLDGVTIYVTADDLLSRQAYDRGLSIQSIDLGLGVDLNALDDMLAKRLRASIDDILRNARLRRIRLQRVVPGMPAEVRKVDVPTLQAAVHDAVRYLVRGVGPDGRYRYFVDAITNSVKSEYGLPRHSGTTWFLVQAAKEPDEIDAARRALGFLRARVVGCGKESCVAEGNVADLGSSAIGLLAFTDAVCGGVDPGARDVVVRLAAFVRSMQRADGEFMHKFERDRARAVDVQWEYFSGEATLALARAHRITGDPADLEAAKKGLAFRVGKGWSFFGDRYWFGEEHWTCQAVEELWDRAPDRKALDFCLHWARFNRAIQQKSGEAQFDVDGSLGVGPIVTPRLTPVAGRTEALVSTLAVAERAGIDARELSELRAQTERALGLLVRNQLRPGPAHLFANPAAVYGAFPASLVEYQIRIDFVQHAGAAMLRWLQLPH